LGAKKDEERDFWCFACAENGARDKNERWRWGRERGRKETFLPSFPSPSPFFYLLHFSRCNSLLPNPTTLGTQAKTHAKRVVPLTDLELPQSVKQLLDEI